MMRLAGLDLDECPKFLSSKPTESNHSVYFPMLNIRLTFQIERTILYISTQRPLKVELKESEDDYMILTPNIPEWEPHATK